MVFAVYFKNGDQGLSQPSSDFLQEIFKSLAVIHPENDLVFITNPGADSFGELPPNVFAENLEIKESFSPINKFRFKNSLLAILKKRQASVLISLSPKLKLKTTAPQIILVRQEEIIPKKSKPELGKASAIIVLDSTLKKQLETEYLVPGPKIHVIQPAIKDIYKPADWDRREKIKEKYSGGKEYFIFRSLQLEKRDLINILKAFSHFKKRQQSSMKMLFVFDKGDKEVFLKDLASYKYRDDVLLIKKPVGDENADLISAAYAIIITSVSEEGLFYSLQSMQCGVPLILSDTEKELQADHALFADITDQKNTGEKLMLIYKDENLRKKLIDAGLRKVSGYSIAKSAEQLSGIIEQAIG